MLMAHPPVRRDPVEQYEALAALHAGAGSPEVRRWMEDVTHTLCVSTGTRDVGAARADAHEQLGEEPSGGGVLLPV
ncbi:DUF5133 domain-containing protein [Streptomyces sp. Wb2n-11]|uniref:DUF5133 domain-containing protein n=1 Tax=Streptomyces sp. Wb2n-11 TaxID=1030533 RepID=UPI000AC693E4|nr:DUF5133 domain-containing protein [Streptomyces sp. Wb2n-11]